MFKGDKKALQHLHRHHIIAKSAWRRGSLGLGGNGKDKVKRAEDPPTKIVFLFPFNFAIVCLPPPKKVSFSKLSQPWFMNIRGPTKGRLQ